MAVRAQVALSHQREAADLLDRALAGDDADGPFLTQFVTDATDRVDQRPEESRSQAV
jgi:hypothetical protein